MHESPYGTKRVRVEGQAVLKTLVGIGASIILTYSPYTIPFRTLKDLGSAVRQQSGGLGPLIAYVRPRTAG